jgi:hypothetical protein
VGAHHAPSEGSEACPWSLTQGEAAPNARARMRVPLSHLDTRVGQYASSVKPKSRPCRSPTAASADGPRSVSTKRMGSPPAQVFELFDQGVGPIDVVKRLQTSPERVIRLHSQWTRLKRTGTNDRRRTSRERDRRARRACLRVVRRRQVMSGGRHRATVEHARWIDRPLTILRRQHWASPGFPGRFCTTNVV